MLDSAFFTVCLIVQKLGVFILEEVFSHFGEGPVGEDILIRSCQACRFLAELGEDGVQVVGRAVGHDLGVPDHLGPDLIGDGCGRLAIEPLDIVLDFFGDQLVALTHEDIHGGLGSDHLGHGGHQGWVAQVRTDVGDFLKNRLIEVGPPLLGKLGEEVGEHAARDLVDQGLGLHLEHLDVEDALVDVLVPDGGEVFGQLLENLQVQAGLIAHLAQADVHGLGSRVGCPAAQGG